MARRSPDVAALLLAAALLLLLLAFTGNSSEICEKAQCGKGTCSEAPGPIPVFTESYQCNCDPGWTKPKLPDPLNLFVTIMPCIIPDCLLDSACYNFSMIDWRGIPLTDMCVIMDCGYGDCKRGQELFSYSCECHPGYNNFLNSTWFPCIKGCALGDDCSKQGIVPPPEPSPPPSAAPPPGSVSLWRLLQQLLSLAILCLLQVV